MSEHTGQLPRDGLVGGLCRLEVGGEKGVNAVTWFQWANLGLFCPKGCEISKSSTVSSNLRSRLPRDRLMDGYKAWSNAPVPKVLERQVM